MARLAVAPEEDYEPRNIGYARVSTDDQRLDLQTDALKRAGCLADDVYVEKLSAAKRARPQLDLALMSLRPGDTFIVWRLDRPARSMADLLRRVSIIEEKGAKLRSLTESFDTATPAGKFLVYILGAVAELERQLTVERTAAGVKARQERGLKVGAPRKVDDKAVEKMGRLLKRGYTVPKLAAKMNISQATIYSYYTIKRKGLKIVITKREKRAA